MPALTPTGLLVPGFIPSTCPCVNTFGTCSRDFTPIIFCLNVPATIAFENKFDY